MEEIEEISKCDFCLVPCKTRMTCPICDKNKANLCELCMNSHLQKHDDYLNNQHLLNEIYLEQEITKQNQSSIC